MKVFSYFFRSFSLSVSVCNGPFAFCVAFSVLRTIFRIRENGPGTLAILIDCLNKIPVYIPAAKVMMLVIVIVTLIVLEYFLKNQIIGDCILLNNSYFLTRCARPIFPTFHASAIGPGTLVKLNVCLSTIPAYTPVANVA